MKETFSRDILIVLELTLDAPKKKVEKCSENGEKSLKRESCASHSKKRLFNFELRAW